MISDPKQLHSINNRVHIAMCRDKGYVELKLPEAVFLVQEIMRLNDELEKLKNPKLEDPYQVNEGTVGGQTPTSECNWGGETVKEGDR